MPLLIKDTAAAKPLFAQDPDEPVNLALGRILWFNFAPEAQAELNEILSPDGYACEFRTCTELNPAFNFQAFDLIVVNCVQSPRQCLESITQKCPEIGAVPVMFAIGSPHPKIIRESYQCGQGALSFPMPERQFLDIVKWSIYSVRMAKIPAEPPPVPAARRFKDAVRKGWWVAVAAILLSFLVALLIQFAMGPGPAKEKSADGAIDQLLKKDLHHYGNK
jgi:hypothetical protein